MVGRSGDGKQNIFYGWPYVVTEIRYMLRILGKETTFVLKNRIDKVYN